MDVRGLVTGDSYWPLSLVCWRSRVLLGLLTVGGVLDLLRLLR